MEVFSGVEAKACVSHLCVCRTPGLVYGLICYAFRRRQRRS